MGKKKRVNPRRIPISESCVDRREVMLTASSANLFWGSLLVVHAMIEQEADAPDDIQRFADIINQINVPDVLQNWQIKEAEKIMGIRDPHPNLERCRIKSQAELQSYKRKARECALHTALAGICLGIAETKHLSAEQLHRIFSNVSLTMAEMEYGCSSFEQLDDDIRSYGWALEESEHDILLKRI